MSGSNPVIAPGARNLVLPDAPLLAPPGGSYVPPSFPSKDPTETLDYVVDWRLAIEEKDVVAAILSTTVVPAGAVVIRSTAIVNTLVLMTVSGGTDLIDAGIILRVRTGLGRLITRKVLLPIRAVDPSTAHGLTGGSYLTFRGSRITVNGSKQTVGATI